MIDLKAKAENSQVSTITNRLDNSLVPGAFRQAVLQFSPLLALDCGLDCGLDF
jgi:hypothetical protein